MQTVSEGMDPRRRIKGFQATQGAWHTLLLAFLRDRTGVKVAEATGVERHCVHRMLSRVRAVMARDLPPPFSGIVEIDETYVGGQWRNKRWPVRRQGTKRGHGTSKQAIFGILSRERKAVVATLVPNLQWETIAPIFARHVAPGSLVCTDGYTIYDPVKRWYRHERVNHTLGEYVRGEVHTNGIESFWGYLKRRLKITGGIREARIAWYVAEEVWRFNHRTLSRDEQAKLLYRNLVEE